MATKTENLMTDLFHQAVETYNDAVKTSVKAQEEIAEWWQDRLGELGSIEDWQDRMQGFAKEVTPLAQQNADECIKLIQQNTQNSLALLRQAFEASRGESVADVQKKTQEIWEASLSAVRQNTEAMVQANAKAMSAWTEMLTRGKNGAAKAKAAN